MKFREIIEKYEAYCPQELSMEGDISGLQVGSLDKEVKKLLVSLDLRETTVAEAIKKNVDAIVVKHAPIFRPLKNLVDSPLQSHLLDLVKHDISVYVSHTNIDIVKDGLNDWFCDLLGITDTEVLSVQHADGSGIGRVGSIQTQTAREFALKVKEVFNLDSVRVVTYDNLDKEISRVAICGGSGQSFYHDALEKGADAYITGDIYYHTGQDMITEGLIGIDPGHHIEILFAKELAKRFKDWSIEENWGINVLATEAQTNPFINL